MARTNGRDKYSLLDSWADYYARRVDSATVAEVHRFDNLFSKGYFISTNAGSETPPDTWDAVSLANGLTLYAAPDLVYSYIDSDGEGSALLVIGHAFCKRWNTKTTKATSNLLQFDLISDSSFTAFERSILECSGRFVAIGFQGGETRVYTDPMATLSCFWATDWDSDHGLHLSSHAGLIAIETAEAGSELKSWIMNHPDYISPGGKALPALITPFDAAKEVFANCFLRIKGTEVSHLRYFPSHRVKELTVTEATDIFIEEMRFNVDAWLNASEHTYFALTVGLDSRTILSSSLDIFKQSRSDVTIMTYHFFERGTDSTAADMLGANKIALEADLPFKIVNIGPFTPEMAHIYNSTFPGWARFPTLASAFYTQLRANSSLMIGIGGEIGTNFYAERSATSISPELLARKYAYSAVSKDPRLIQLFAEYIDYTQFYDERLHGYDLHDLFYWEHRLTKWAGASYAEYDLAATVALPFNSRNLILAMLAVPESDRSEKSIYSELSKRSLI